MPEMRLPLLANDPRALRFDARAAEALGTSLRADGVGTLQVNLGKLCNMTCRHCHVDAGPDRREVMSRDTMQLCLDALAKSDIGTVDVILTAGGTGLSSRDVTPDATAPLLERLIPGIPDAIRMLGRSQTPAAILSRGLAGVAKGTLIVNLPGGSGAVRDGLAILLPVLEHASDAIGERDRS